MIETKIISPIEEILMGLKSKNKFISSKWFYDEKGDKIFQEIMAMPEYYLTRKEYEIFDSRGDEIIGRLPQNQQINIVELGAGDGLKTRILLKKMLAKGMEIQYMPVDISKHILIELQSALAQEIPSLKVIPQNLEYFEALNRISNTGHSINLIMLLGSNMGNLHYDEALIFMNKLVLHANTNDYFLLGQDLKKDPKIISKAYDDPHGITERFNLNLLLRLNTEFGADFIMEQFGHHTFYEPISGEVRSFLYSKCNQEIRFPGQKESIVFKSNELIHTEISKKYDLETLEAMAEEVGLEVLKHYTDRKHFFTDSLFKIK